MRCTNHASDKGGGMERELTETAFVGERLLYAKIIERAAWVACSEARSIIDEIRKTKHDIFMAICSGSAWGKKITPTSKPADADAAFLNNE